MYDLFSAPDYGGEIGALHFYFGLGIIHAVFFYTARCIMARGNKHTTYINNVQAFSLGFFVFLVLMGVFSAFFPNSFSWYAFNHGFTVGEETVFTPR